MSFTPGAGTRFLVSTGASGTTPLSGPLSITGGTATANAPVLNATQTWNNAAVTFTGWQLNVTDTASNAASLLMDLQVGGASFFGVQKDGKVLAGSSNGSAVGGYRFQSLPNIGMFLQTTNIGAGSNVLSFRDVSGSVVFAMNGGSVRVAADQVFGWSSNNQANAAAADVSLYRDAANTLAQRNGVNWQAFRIYSTYTDASNYERLEISQSGTGWYIGNGALGTGPGNRQITILAFGQLVFGSNGGAKWLINTTGHLLANTDNSFDIGASGANRPRNLILGSYQEMSEMTAPAAPAANSVRIYAEDNGSGKTRLMARFATGAAQQIAIEP